MKFEIASGRALTIAATLLSSTIATADDIILHADFDSDPLGAPSTNPPSLPAGDSLEFLSGNFSIVSDDLVAGNQFLEGISPILPGGFNAVADPDFDSANGVDSLFKIAWTSSVGANTSATIAVANGDSTSLFVAYDGPSQSILVNDANGLAVSPPTPLTFVPDAFQDFTVDVDFSAESYSLAVDGNLVGSDLPLIAGSSRGFDQIQFDYATDISLTSGMPFMPGSPAPVGILSVDTIYATAVETQSTVEVSFDVGFKSRFFHRPAHGHGFIPVVIHGSETLDVSQIDLESLSLNGLSLAETWGRAPHFVCDLSSPTGTRDEFPDLICIFKFDGDLWETPEADNLYLLSGFLENGNLLIGAEAAEAKRPVKENRRNWPSKRSLRSYNF